MPFSECLVDLELCRNGCVLREGRHGIAVEGRDAMNADLWIRERCRRVARQFFDCFGRGTIADEPFPWLGGVRSRERGATCATKAIMHPDQALPFTCEIGVYSSTSTLYTVSGVRR